LAYLYCTVPCWDVWWHSFFLVFSGHTGTGTGMYSVLLLSIIV
jgi:hypothetical protein